MDEVIEQANNNPYGLAAAVWTRDVKKAHSVSRRLKAGTVWINTYGLMDASLPFGGYKSSGFGRELGAHAIEHYTELKTVWLNRQASRPGQKGAERVRLVRTFRSLWFRKVC